MLAKIRYILIVLLFAAMGVFCRMQAAWHPEDFGDKTFLVQQPMSHGSDATRFLGHSLLAPELINEVQSQNSDQKTLPKFTSFPSHGPIAKPAVRNATCRNVVTVHPNSIDYYIFSLEKIRI